MPTVLKSVSPAKARSRQREILLELDVTKQELLDRVDNYEFEWNDQILAEEFARLHYLLSGLE